MTAIARKNDVIPATLAAALQQFDALPDSAYIRQSQLVGARAREADPVKKKPARPASAGILPFSDMTLSRKVKNGTFPPPVMLSARVKAWRVGTVREYLRNCATN